MYLFSNIEKIKKNLKDKFIYLFLDFDGTLSEIARKPSLAVFPEANRESLESLKRKKNFRVAIISGRSLKNLKKVIGIKGIYYSGNHGLQFSAGHSYSCRIPKGYRKILRKIKKESAQRFGRIKGVLIEDKEITLSIHYRMVDKKDIFAIKKGFDDIIRPFIKSGSVKLIKGKKVFEVKPPVDWNKGKAVLSLMREEKRISKNSNLIPLYIGDDITDRDAFRAIRGEGLTIFVGREKGMLGAQYYLKNTKEVTKFLKILTGI